MFPPVPATETRKGIMSTIRLTDAKVRVLRPKKETRNVRDSVLAGFGVRILPSCRKRLFVHSQHERRRTWRIVGDPADMTVAEARESARGILAAMRAGVRFRTRRRCSRPWRKPRSDGTAGTGSQAHSRRTGTISGSRSCLGSGDGRSRRARRRTCGIGLPRCARRRCLRTGRCPCRQSS